LWAEYLPIHRITGKSVCHHLRPCGWIHPPYIATIKMDTFAGPMGNVNGTRQLLNGFAPLVISLRS
ncbi:MAG: hypothetical protein QMD04_06785, partial [Anaerolineales bacterium]|nr:hypothetical protein [Anaerolineales bacterium]